MAASNHNALSHSIREPFTPDAVEYASLESLPEPKKETSFKVKVASLLVVALFVAGALYYVFRTPDGKDHASTAAKQARAQLDAELKKLAPYMGAVLMGGGLALLLFGRRLFTLAVGIAGALAGGFIAYTLFTTATSEWTGMSAQHKMWLTIALTAVGSALLGGALAKLERFGMAVMAGCAGFACGELLYPVTLDHFVTVWWGQYACGGVCALAAFVFMYVYEKGLLAVTTSAFGAFVCTTGGAKLFFDYSPTSKDFQAHWGNWHKDEQQVSTGDDKDFWIFLGSVLGLFLLGLLVQLKLDPYVAKRRQKEQLSFYDEETAQTQQRIVVAAPSSQGVRFF